MTPSKSMPQKSNYEFKEKYPYVSVGSLEPMLFFLLLASVLEYENER